MTQEKLDELLKSVLEATEDTDRQNAVADLRTSIIDDTANLEKERDTYKEKYETTHKQNVDLFLQVQKGQADFKNDSHNISDNPHAQMKKDKEEDEKQNMTYNDLLNNMKGELF